MYRRAVEEVAAGLAAQVGATMCRMQEQAQYHLERSAAAQARAEAAERKADAAVEQVQRLRAELRDLGLGGGGPVGGGPVGGAPYAGVCDAVTQLTLRVSELERAAGARGAVPAPAPAAAPAAELRALARRVALLEGWGATGGPPPPPPPAWAPQQRDPAAMASALDAAAQLRSDVASDQLRLHLQEQQVALREDMERALSAASAAATSAAEDARAAAVAGGAAGCTAAARIDARVDALERTLQAKTQMLEGTLEAKTRMLEHRLEARFEEVLRGSLLGRAASACALQAAQPASAAAGSPALMATPHSSVGRARDAAWSPPPARGPG